MTRLMGLALVVVLATAGSTARAEEAQDWALSTSEEDEKLRTLKGEGTQEEWDPGNYVSEALERVGVPIRLSGYFWVDTGYMKRTNAQAGQYDQDAAYMQGRFVLGASYSREFGDYFGLARVKLMGLVNEYAKSQYEPHTLDAFVRIGHKKWGDVQVGRFLAWEVYHRGQGIDLFTAEEAGALGAPEMYWLQTTRGYRNEAGQAALHLYPLDALRFEVAGVYGQESNQNNFGVRPVVDLRLGGFQAKAGYELLRQVPQTIADKVETTVNGFAGMVKYSFPVVTVGANFGWEDVYVIDIQGLTDSSKSLKKWSAGGFVDIDFWRGSIGLGYHHTNQLNRRDEQLSHHQAFLSYLIRLPIKGLWVKAVYGFALGHIEDADTRSSWDNTMHSFRVRISYVFD